MNELLNGEIFHTLKEAKILIEQWRVHYNTVRPHSDLKWKPPAGQKVTMRSLDFWRCEEGLIRENWGLVDLLDVYTQIGVDVFRRMEEFTYDRQR